MWVLLRGTVADSDEAAKGKEGVHWEVAEPESGRLLLEIRLLRATHLRMAEGLVVLQSSTV